MAEFVDVYVTATGKKHRVPAHFLDNPVLMRPFSKTPKAKAAEQARPAGASNRPAPVPAPASAGPDNPDTPTAGDKE